MAAEEPEAAVARMDDPEGMLREMRKLQGPSSPPEWREAARRLERTIHEMLRRDQAPVETTAPAAQARPRETAHAAARRGGDSGDDSPSRPAGGAEPAPVVRGRLRRRRLFGFRARLFAAAPAAADSLAAAVQRVQREQERGR